MQNRIIACYVTVIVFISIGCSFAQSDPSINPPANREPATSVQSNNDQGRAEGAKRAQSSPRHDIEALVAACVGHRTEVAKAIIERGVDLDGRDSQGLTALCATSAISDIFLTDLLLKHGANPNVQDAKGRSPIHHAAAGANAVIIKMLLNHGARLDDTDHENSTPLGLLQAVDPTTVAWIEEEFAESLDYFLIKKIDKTLGMAADLKNRAKETLMLRKMTISETQRQLDDLRNRARAASVQTRTRRIYGTSPNPSNTYTDSLGSYVVESRIVDGGIEPDDFKVHDHEFPIPERTFELLQQAERHGQQALAIAECCFPNNRKLINIVREALRP